MAGRFGELVDAPPPSQQPAGVPAHARAARNAGGVELPMPSGMPSRQIVTSVPPADVSPIPGARDFFRIERGTNVGAGVTVDPATLVLQIAQSDYAAIQFFSIFINAPTLASDVIWTLRRNGAPVPGFEAVTFAPRAAQSFERTFPCDIKCQTGTKISVTIKNQGAGAELLGSSFGGWSWNRISGERYTGLPFLTVR